MPRSFLVKRRKSADAKSEPDAGASHETRVQHCNHPGEKLQSLPYGWCIDCHPRLLPSTVLEKNHNNNWNHSNASCFLWSPPRALPPLCHGCVKFTARSNCDPHCSIESYQRKLNECTSCRSCLSCRKLMPNGTQLNMPPWYHGASYDSACHGIFQHKRDPFLPKSLVTPFERIDFHAGGMARDLNGIHVPTAHHVSICHGRFNANLESNLTVVRKEDVLTQSPVSVVNEKILEINEELPAKKIKIAPSSTLDHDSIKEGIKKLDSQSTNTLIAAGEDDSDLTKLSESESDVLSQELPHRKIKEEFLEEQEEITEGCELKNDKEESDSNSVDHAVGVPVPETETHRVTRKKQSAKTRRGIRNGSIKPYNTRVVTSRPRTYSSDFVIPDEEDWKHDSEAFENTVKGRHRSKLNRLLANEHERRRVAQLNNAYQDLRQLIPGYQCDTKLPKIKILKYAINYIAHLGDLLDD